MNRTLLRQALPWLILLLAGVVSVVLRYALIQPREFVDLCSVAQPPAICIWRQWIVEGFLSYGYGIAALLASGLALLWRRAWSATLAAALGVLALQLFCYEAGAAALLLGVLLLVHAQRGPLAAPVAQHR